MPDDATLPWATVSYFSPDMHLELPSNLSKAALQSYVEAKLPTLNTYFAFRISHFSPFFDYVLAQILVI